MKPLCLPVFAAVVLTLSVGPARATKIDPLPWQQLVLQADFVGIVECEVAGGIVAEYQVIESWKGPKVGTRFRVREGVNYWGGQFPIALCGQRYYLTAFRNPPDNLISTSSGGGVPLWWRNIPADYKLPLGQGSWLLPPDADKDKEFLAFQEKVKDLIIAGPDKQEETLLRVQVEKYLLGGDGEKGQDAGKLKELRARLDQAGSTAALVKELLQLAASDPKKWGLLVRIVLAQGGMAVTLAELEKAGGKLPWDKETSDGIIASIKQRTGAAKSPMRTPGHEPKPPTEGDLDRLRKTLAGGPKSEDYGKAFETLTRYDPAAVAAHLRAWEPRRDELWRERDRGYDLASYFCWRCGKDRAKYLASLLDAGDDWVRVAGAVYLCFENEKKGITALKELVSLKGNPGTWAALTLARRGHKEAVPRLLEVFGPLTKEEKETGMSAVPRANLRGRTLVLLSNSARLSKLEALQLPFSDEDEKDFKVALKWWKTHQNELKLHDPWMELLAKQKID